MPITLKPLSIKGFGSGGGGGEWFEPIWGSNTSYFYGPYAGSGGPGAAPVLNNQDNIYYGNLIKKVTGQEKSVFELQLLDKAINQDNSLGAVADVWVTIGKSLSSWGGIPVDFNYAKEDVYFRNKVISFSKADELQQNFGLTKSEAIQKVASSASANDTIHDVSTNTLSGDSFSAAKAFAHYLWGDGQNLNVNINNIGLNIKASEIPLLTQTVRSNTEIGSVHISSNVAYNTSNDSLKTGLYLGNITLKVEGDFNKQANGAWTFDGVAKGYQDKYDFNEATRGFVGETLTSFGRVASGTTYNIDITGESKISLVGFGTHVD